MRLNVPPRTIFCHDNLEVLQGLNSECIDLIYLDPPFNKNKVFTAPIGSSAEGAEFSDIFRAEDVKDEWVGNIRYENYELHNYLQGVKQFSNKYNYCYLVYMAIRLIECKRLLKPTGSLYLHCDPTMSHYLKIVLDCIFGEGNFRNEIVWCYHGPGSPAMRQFNRKTDTILWYSKGSKWVFNKDAVRIPHKGEGPHTGGYGIDKTLAREYGQKGKVPENWWVIRIAARSKTEFTGYPTQKPLALLERIIAASSKKGAVVLDPFCGCATTCIAAEKLGRKWIGVDVSHKAYELVQQRLKKEVTLFQPDDPNYSVTPPKRGSGDKREQGYVYVISNAAWAGRYKVGIAKDVAQRLSSYQTSDPMRAYKVEYKVRTPNFKQIEATLHATFPAHHEWLTADLQTIIQKIKSLK